MQLKNAYLFKEQCEKTDLFLRDYLKNLNGQNIKEEGSAGDVDFVDNLAGDDSTLDDDDSCTKTETDDIKDDPETNAGETGDKSLDYIQVWKGTINIVL